MFVLFFKLPLEYFTRCRFGQLVNKDDVSRFLKTGHAFFAYLDNFPFTYGRAFIQGHNGHDFFLQPVVRHPMTATSITLGCAAMTSSISLG